LTQQSHDSENLLHYSDTSSDLSDSAGEQEFVLGVQPKSKKRLHLPPAGIMHQLWEAFVENFDPLTKLVHVPTLEPAVQKAINSIETIPRNLEALMFSILSAAILTLHDKDCQQRFNEARRSMLVRYTSATEAALSRAKFMSTTSLVVLQALVIHLYAVRDIYEPRTVWTLTGVAVRIAQGIGLDRDGTVLGLSPFDTEIRRRIWWQLKSHDFRTAELCGLAKFRDLATGAENTKWPANIDDKDLRPSMTSLEPATTGLTDASFVAFKFEMTKFAGSRIANFRKLGKDPSDWNLDTADNDKDETRASVKILQETLEMKYLRYCDPSQPLHLALLLIGRYGMNIVTFLTHHPRRWATMAHVPLTERTLVWDGSIKLLEQYNMMLTNPLVCQFAWHAPYFQQWHAFIHILDTLRADPIRPDASKAWQLVGSIYENTPELGSDMKKPIHVAIGNLCLKAYNARESALRSKSMFCPPTPGFVENLRQHRTTAIAKRLARREKLHQQHQPNISLANSGPAVPTDRQHGSHDVLLAQQSSILNPSNLYQATDSAEIDPFHLFENINDNDQADNYMDLDYGLLDNYNMDDCAPEPIDWEQWDVWLADSNVMRSSSS
jgi:hypothetical protein